MEMDQSREEHKHHLSGAYIRSLVTSPTTMNPPPKDLNFSEQESLGPQRHKKQVRRRLHTTRPYQERLLNMAEARKEIVTALKYHRASMKQQQQPHPPTPTQPCFEPEPTIKSMRNPRSNSPFPPSPNHLPWSAPEIGTPSLANFTLPNHPLGLTPYPYPYPCHNNINPSSICPSPSSSSVGTQDSPSVATISPVEADRSGGGLHQAMDDEEMAEIRSIGEQHEMEWNDSMNLVTSAWWFKFFKEEEEEEEACITNDGYNYNPFDEVMQMQFPSN